MANHFSVGETVQAVEEGAIKNRMLSIKKAVRIKETHRFLCLKEYVL